MDAPLPPTVAIPPYSVADATPEDLLDLVVPLARMPRPAVMFDLHVGSLNNRHAPGVAAALEVADVQYADGMAVVVAARAAGARRIRRTPLTEWGHDALDRLAAAGLRRVALVGGPDGLAARAATVLTARHDVEVVYLTHGFHTAWDGPLSDLSAARPDVVFVGLGVPLEYRFVAEHVAALPPALVLTAGGWFAKVAGDERRAPALLGRIGMEWLWRLAQSPRRLAGRYLRGVVTVLVLVVRGLAGRAARRPRG